MRIWTRSIILTLSSFLPSVCAARDVQLAPVAPDADGGVAIDGGTLTYLTTAGELVAVENGQTRRIVGPEQLPTGTDIHQFSAAGGGDAAIWTNNGNFVIQGGTLRPLMSDIGIQSTDAIPSADAEGVAYTAFNGVALFLDRSGQVTRLADNSTPMPGGNGAIFNRFGPVALRGQQVAFRGVGERFFPGVPPVSVTGIYASDGDGLTRVADTNTAVPGGVGNFAQFQGNHVQTDGSAVFFGGADAVGSPGIYTTQGGTLRTVADRATLIPGTDAERFDSFGISFSVDDGNIVFHATGPQTSGFFLDSGGQLSAVITSNDTINGRSIELLDASSEALSDGRFVFYARFTDQTSGTFIVSIPEPGFASLLIGMSLAAALARPRGRRAGRCRG
jgi:hypothetical protein